MKKMFSKILMLLAVTVGMGVAVTSCKDTNDDLQDQIDQIRNIIEGENDNLFNVLNGNIGNLERWLGQLQNQVNLINSCECDMGPLWAALGEMQNLLEQRMDSLNHRGEVKLDTATQMLNQQIIHLRAFLVENYVTKQMLDSVVHKLHVAIDSAACKCDFTDILRRLSDVERAAAEAKALALTADSAAARARIAAGNAQATADSALALAKKGYNLAETANIAAAVADSIARKALALGKQNAADIITINERLVTMSDSLKTAYENAAAAVAQAEANKLRIEKLDSSMTVAERKIVDLTDRLDSLEGNYNQFKEGYQQFYDYTTHTLDSLCALSHLTQAQVEALIDERTALMKQQIATNSNNIDSLCQVVDSICNLTTDMQNEDARLNERIDSLARVTTGLEEVDEDLQKQIDSLCTEILNTQDRVKAIEDSYVTRDEFNNTVDSICSLIDATNVRIDSLELAYQKADELLQDQIDDLSRRLDALEDALLGADGAIATLEDLEPRVAAVETTLQNMITGILVQGTYNPAFGMVSLPANINSNVLIAYYGDANNDIYFPTNRTGNYVHPSEALTEKDIEMIGAEDTPLFSSGDRILMNEDSNAGTLYVTVNPNTVDFTGEVLTLENSQAKESGIKLGELKKSDKVLEFGYTRAADNGFYEAPAYVEADKISQVQKINFNRDIIKNDIKEIMEKRQHANFEGISGDIYDLIMDTKLDANAVKATWTDGNEETHDVFSNYCIAATAIKPLSFETLKDLNVVTIPGYEKIMKFIDKVAEKVGATIDNTGIFEDMRELQEKGLAIDIRAADLINFDQIKKMIDLKITFKINKKWDIDDRTFYFNDYLEGKLFFVDGDGTSHTVQVNPDAHVTIDDMTITVDETLSYDMEPLLSIMVAGINKEIDEQNTMILTITDFMKDCCDFMDQVYELKGDFIDANVDRLANKLKSLLAKGNDYVTHLINGIHARLQPVLIISTDDGSHLLSTAKNAPSRIGSDVTFVPTSWTIELIVPICKKHVAVTNVFKGKASAQDGDADCKAALEAVNEGENVNEVIDGNIRNIKIEGLQKGYTYEVAYSALDYHGKIATKKYYITPKN